MLELTGERRTTSPSRPAVAPERTGRPTTRRRILSAAGEVLAAVGAAALLLLLTRRVVIDPLDRIGQVSGLAAIGLRYTVIAIAGLAVVVLAARWRAGSLFPVAVRLACAATAGLISGFVGSGILLALDGTTWPLFASTGDAGVISGWLADLQNGRAIPSGYPPLAIHAMALWSDLTGAEGPAVLRSTQIVGTALFGPAVYLAWRLLLSAPWALAVGVVSSLVLIDPYKPYAPVVLAILVPVLITMLRVLRCSAGLSWRALIGRGLLIGAGLGLLFLTYSGWFVWSAVGAVAGVLALFPWRAGPVRGAAFLGVTGATFAAVAAPHLLGLLAASGSVRDEYFYFDVFTEPGYIGSWRGDLAGDTSGAWPATAELAGVGLFSVLLVVGIGLAIWLAGSRTVVLTLAFLIGGAWIMRFWFASQMFGTGTVQLYPRTTQQLLYCSLLLVGFAVFYGAERLRLRESLRLLPVPRSTGDADGRPRSPRDAAAVLGTLVAVLTLGLFAGSATADRYMPRNDGGPGKLAHVAQLVRQPDGSCPAHVGPEGCVETTDEALGTPDRIPDAAPGG
jgi:galactan 5-O-arabinofuranosyltransferase